MSCKRWMAIAPTEHQEQVTVVQWAMSQRAVLPQAALLFAIPNGGDRPKVTKVGRDSAIVRFSPEALRLKLSGVQPGVPDLMLPVPRGKWHGLFIEMKSRSGKVRAEQREWLRILRRHGYGAIICRGADAAIEAIRGYLVDPEWSHSQTRGAE